MAGDIFHGRVDLLDQSIQRLEDMCNRAQSDNNQKVEKLIHQLTTEDWTDSKDSEAFRAKFSEYQRNLSSMASYYAMIIQDLRQIRDQVNQQMNTKPNIHYSDF